MTFLGGTGIAMVGLVLFLHDLVAHFGEVNLCVKLNSMMNVGTAWRFFRDWSVTKPKRGGILDRRNSKKKCRA
jgi:hypothetical protein